MFYEVLKTKYKSAAQGGLVDACAAYVMATSQIWLLPGILLHVIAHFLSTCFLLHVYCRA